MTKSELVAKIAEKAELTKAQAEKALGAFTSSVEEALKAGDRVALVGFGTFAVANRAARKGRNPSTGAEMDIPAKSSAKFSPGKELKDLKA